MQHKFWDINGVVPVQRITGWPQQCFIYIEVRIKLLWINLLGIKAFFSTFFWSEPWSLDLLAVSGNENCLLSLRTMSFFVEPCQMKQSELINSFGLPLINWQIFETKLGVNKLLLCEMYSLLFFKPLPVLCTMSLVLPFKKIFYFDCILLLQICSFCYH